MYTCKVKSSSTQNLCAIISDSIVDGSKANRNRLIDELKRGGIEFTAERDLGAILRSCTGRCIVYLSPQPVSDVFKNSLLSFAERRGRDAVVIIVDDALETPAGEWVQFLCIRYKDQHVKELCRELALLIRTPLLCCRPQDITGYAAAFRTVNGYLRFVLPNFHIRLKELYPDIYSRCVKKLLIICPESCYCPPTMTVEGSIEHADEYVLRNVTRAGQRHRDFSASVYCIRDTRLKRDYYFAAGFDSSLASLGDIQSSGLVGIDDVGMHAERNDYILHLKQLLKHSKNARNYAGQYRVLYWINHHVSFGKFLLSICREELESDPEEVFQTHTDFECVDGRGVSPGSLYANPTECYRLDSKPKGICLVINIAEFDPPILPKRIGSEVDVRELTAVFQWLKFEVVVHRDVTKLEFLRIINETRKRDHSAYDAFVCCAMSHGYLGHIYTADCQSVSIRDDIARAFYPENCPTLADGKPKMFFIQACQRIQTSGPNTHSSVAGHVGTTEIEGEFSVASETFTLESDAEICGAPENRKRSHYVPNAPDFTISMSTLPHSASYRDPEKGTFYIQALTKVLKQGLELQASLDKVALYVEKEAPGHQRPFYYVSTDHKLIFLCGKLFAVLLRIHMSVKFWF